MIYTEVGQNSFHQLKIIYPFVFLAIPQDEAFCSVATPQFLSFALPKKHSNEGGTNNDFASIGSIAFKTRDYGRLDTLKVAYACRQNLRLRALLPIFSNG